MDLDMDLSQKFFIKEAGTHPTLKTQTFVVKEPKGFISIIQIDLYNMIYKVIFSTCKSYMLNRYISLREMTQVEYFTCEMIKHIFSLDEVYEIENTKESIEKEIFLIGL